MSSLRQICLSLRQGVREDVWNFHIGGCQVTEAIYVAIQHAKL